MQIASTTSSLLHSVRSHGVFGLALWRDECVRKDVAPALMQDALRDGLVALRATTPAMIAEQPVPESGLRGVLWRRTLISHHLAAEAIGIADALDVVLRGGVTRSPTEQATAALHAAIVEHSDGERRLGYALHPIVKQWPRFDPIAGYGDPPFERALAVAWMKRSGSALSDQDHMTLRLALKTHANRPTVDFADHVAAAVQFAGGLVSPDDVRVEAAVEPAAVEAARAVAVEAPPPLRA
jgi:hypothetical protein